MRRASSKKKESITVESPLEGSPEKTKKRGRSPSKKDKSESSSKSSSPSKKKVTDHGIDKRVTRSQDRSRSKSPKKAKVKKTSKSPVKRAASKTKSKSPIKKKTKKKPASVTRKTKPTYSIMIARAIHELGDLRSGSSSIAIGKYIKSTYPSPADLNRRLRVALDKAEESKYLTRIKNSYKLTDKGSRVLLSKRDQKKKTVITPVKRAIKKTTTKTVSKKLIEKRDKKDRKDNKEKKKRKKRKIGKKSLQNVVLLE